MSTRKIKRGLWGRPPKPFVADEQRWDAFLKMLDARIAHLRAAEGIDSRIAPWRTFETPLSAEPPVYLPVRIRLMAAPNVERDPRNGRILGPKRRAS